MKITSPKNRFFLKHSKSSAIAVSVGIHLVFVVVALTFVAVRIHIKPEQTFEVKEIARPPMKLRPLQVPVKDQKKSQAPKLRKTIVAKPKTPTVDLKMPEIVGVKGGTGYGRGGGLGGLGFGFDMDLFGGNRGSGNEFVGTFYDLKKKENGEPSKIGTLLANRGDAMGESLDTIRSFINSGFNADRLKKHYFQAPRLKYASAFMMPYMPANEAPKAYSVEDQVKPSFWVCHYKGQIAAPEDGRYRFWGLGDDVLAVRVGRSLVLDACWKEHRGRMSRWDSSDANNRKFTSDTGYGGKDAQYMNSSSMLVIGDWFRLKKGAVVDVDILIGEIPGGWFSCRLLIEQEGKEYAMVQSNGGQRPVLPVFKTTPIDEELLPKMKINSSIATTEGPVFGVLINAQ